VSRGKQRPRSERGKRAPVRKGGRSEPRGHGRGEGKRNAPRSNRPIGYQTPVGKRGHLSY
jgi:hypothetical protein